MTSRPPDQITGHLRSLEEQLLQPEVRKDPALLATLIADDFVEIGASGRTYDKAAILQLLEHEPSRPTVLLNNFSARQLRDDIVLVTYQTTRIDPSGKTISAAKRSSIWINREDRWQVTFHQGTPLQHLD